MAPSHAASLARDWLKRWTGESTGRAIEPRNSNIGMPTLWLCAEGNILDTASARWTGAREVEDPGTDGHVMRGNREIPCSPEGRGLGRIGKSKDRSR